jgi:16S rRNA (cytidine1402-2'-O)-methyltransferase
MNRPLVYLIPSQLNETGFQAFPFYLTDAIKNCQVLFVENERTARRFLKKLWKTYLPGQEIVIDDFEWIVSDGSKQAEDLFRQKIKEGKTIGIISEAGCPGVADPGQELIRIAHELNVTVKPLVGPSSILLALMASGMNGQQFQFVGYLPIDNNQRIKKIKELEAESQKKNCTQIFIETPYRNNQMIEALCKNCNPSTSLCIAVDLTGENEWIKTRTIEEWSEGLLSEKKEKTDLHKRPVIFLLLA